MRTPNSHGARRGGVRRARAAGAGRRDKRVGTIRLARSTRSDMDHGQLRLSFTSTGGPLLIV